MNCRKVIKVLGILSIIGALLGFAAGAFLVVGGGAMTAMSGNEEFMGEVQNQIENDPESAAKLAELNEQLANENMNMDAQGAVAFSGVALLILGVTLIISGIFSIVEAVLAFKAAGGKGAQPAFIFGIISLVFTVIAALSSGIQGIGTYFVSIVLNVLYVYCAKTIKDEEANA